MKHCEIIECRRKIAKLQARAPNNDLVSVLSRALIQSSELKSPRDQPGCEPPILEIEKKSPLTEKLRLMIGFNFEPSLYMFRSDPAHQILESHWSRQPFLQHMPQVGEVYGTSGGL